MVTPPAALPVSVLAALPAATQSAAKPESAEQTVATQLQLQQETKQVGEETLHFCTLQVTPTLVQAIAACPHLKTIACCLGNRESTPWHVRGNPNRLLW